MYGSTGTGTQRAIAGNGTMVIGLVRLMQAPAGCCLAMKAEDSMKAIGKAKVAGLTMTTGGTGTTIAIIETTTKSNYWRGAVALF